MILGPDGKATTGSQLITPEWVVREMVEDARRREADSRVRALRESVGVPPYGPKIGDTIRVRMPARFLVEKQEAYGTDA